MNVERIEVRTLKVPLKAPFVTSFGRFDIDEEALRRFTVHTESFGGKGS